jgi:hypothetical protein
MLGSIDELGESESAAEARITNHDLRITITLNSQEPSTLALREDARGPMITMASAQALAQFYFKEECFL